MSLNKGKIYIGLLREIILIWAYLLGIGAFVGMLYGAASKDFIRDIYYIIMPLVYLLLATNWKKMKIISIEIIRQGFIIAATILSFLHIFLLIVVYKMDIMASRGGIMGFESVVTCIGFYFLLETDKKKCNNKMARLLLMLLSIGLYVSRTLYIMFIIIGVVVYSGYIKSNIGKIIKAIAVIFIIIICLRFILPSSVLQYFMSKVLNSFTEISIKQKWDFSTINTNWRGYERYLIIDEIKKGGLMKQLFGFGFGKRLNLRMSIDLAGTVYNDIPTFHSGFFYILYKTGLLGVSALGSFFVIIFMKFRAIKIKYLRKINIGVLLFAFVQMFVSTGFFEAGAYAGITLLMGACIERRKGVK